MAAKAAAKFSPVTWTACSAVPPWVRMTLLTASRKSSSSSIIWWISKMAALSSPTSPTALS